MKRAHVLLRVENGHPGAIAGSLPSLAARLVPDAVAARKLKGRRVLADQMEYLVAHFPRSSPLHERMQRWPM